MSEQHYALQDVKGDVRVDGVDTSWSVNDGILHIIRREEYSVPENFYFRLVGVVPSWKEVEA